jgi:hypothetical protein
VAAVGLRGCALPPFEGQIDMTQEPKSVAADHGRAAPPQSELEPEIDLAERRKVYRWFVRCTFLFAAHVLAVLLVLGYLFSDGFG